MNDPVDLLLQQQFQQRVGRIDDLLYDLPD